MSAPAARVQELEPGAHCPAPTGDISAVLAASHRAGDVALDPATAATDTNAHVTGSAAAFVRCVAATGRRASIALAVPLTRGQSSTFAYGRGARVTIGGDLSADTLTEQVGGADRH